MGDAFRILLNGYGGGCGDRDGTWWSFEGGVMFGASVEGLLNPSKGNTCVKDPLKELTQNLYFYHTCL